MSFKFPERHNEYSLKVLNDLKVDHQLQAFVALKARVRDIWRDEFEDDFYLFKWLKARQFNPHEAEKMLRDHLKWREKMDMDNLLTEFKHPEVLKRYSTGGFCGRDRMHRPVWYDPLGFGDPEGIAKSATKTDIIKSRLFISEYVHRIMLPQIRKETGLPIYQIVVVYDFQNFGSRHMWGPTVELFTELTELCQANYPESMGAAYVINTSSLFSMAYSLIKPLLRPETHTKVQFLGSDYKEALLKELNVSEVPVAYGGEKLGPDGDPKCSEWICYGGDVPQVYYLQPLHRMEHTTVGRYSNFDVHVKVMQKDCFIEWEFSTDESDITLEIFHRGKSSETCVFQRRVSESHLTPCRGYVQCSEEGRYIVRFNNSSSWVWNKTLHYYVDVVQERPELSRSAPEACTSPAEINQPPIPAYLVEAEAILDEMRHKKQQLSSEID